MGLTIDKAFALQAPFRRAGVVATLELTLLERVLLLKIWILPVMVWTAKAYPPPRPLCNGHALVQATVGVGTILIWYQMLYFHCHY